MIKRTWGNTVIWTATATLVKILATLLVIKVIAFYYGAKGVGRAANYMTLLTVLGVFAGAGIFNGVTKYVAEYENQPQKLAQILSTSFIIVTFFSLCLALIGQFFAEPIAVFIFGDDSYQSVIRMLSVLQCGIALGNYFLAVLKGRREAKYTSLATIFGILFGLVLFLSAMYCYQYQGVLIGLALIPTAMTLPAYYFLCQKCGQNLKCFDKSHWRTDYARHFGKFGIMTFTTVVTVPLAYILLRNRLEMTHGIEAVGLWQGVSKISDAYLQFITGAFSVYLLPTFAKLTDKTAIRHEVFTALKFAFPIIVMLAVGIYTTRSLIIQWLFSAQFLPMKELFLWQLIGDIFKVGCYVFGYLMVAKSALRLYILAELSQCILLLAFAMYLIPTAGATGAVQAYMFTYVLHFTLCMTLFFFYQRETK